MADQPQTLALNDLHAETHLSRSLFQDGHLQEAVRKAAERYVNRVAELADHPDSQSRQGRGLIERVFSQEDPILVFNSHEDLDDWTLVDRDAHNGYRFLAVGLVQGIRNVLTHVDEYALTSTEALEWLAFISAMHRRLDDVQQVFPSLSANTEEGQGPAGDDS